MHPRLFAQSAPDRPAVIMTATGETITYAALEARSNQAAHLFRRKGLTAGDTIALFMENDIAWFEICWGAQRAGLYFTPISSRLTRQEAEYIVRDCGAKALVASARLKGAAEPLAEVVEAAFSVGGAMEGFETWGTARTAEPEDPIADERSGGPMFYSSGTTGRPKGVRFPLSNEPATAPMAHSEFVREVFGFGSDTVYLSPAPLYHAAPISYCMFIHRSGGTVAVMDRFTPEAALEAIERHRVTHSQWAPTMFIRMLKLSDAERSRRDLSSHRVAIHAAAPCPVWVKQAMIAWWGPILHEYYGGSEGAGVTMITSEESLVRPGSVGRPVVGVIHIAGEDGSELGPGEEGVVYFEGGADFAYHNDPAKTEASRHPAHPDWATLGDIGYVDADGYLYLTDRKDFMVVTGGVNVYPQEVENLLVSHPKVADAAVFGVPDEDLGEAVKAVIEPLDWSDAGPALRDELIALCREQLAGPKRPKTLDFSRSLPRLPTGKLQKRVLRDPYWAGRDARIG